MWVWKLKCKHCTEWFKRPERDIDIIVAMGVKFCSKICRVKFIAHKNKLKKEKLRTKNIKKKEKKANSISSLTKKADKLWAECVKIRDWYECVYCWKKEYLNSHHLFTRWWVDNWITLCSWHHTLSSTFSAHQTWLEFFEWLEKQKGREWIDNVSQKSRQIIKVTPDFIKEETELLEMYKKCIQEK